MGRIDPARHSPPRGPGGRAKVLLGIAAALAIAIAFYELGRGASAPPPRAASPEAAAPAAWARPTRAAVRATPVAPSTDELLAAFERARPSPREEQSEMRVMVPRPEPPTAAQSPHPEVTVSPETPRDKMARCLTFKVENDEIHYGGYSPLISPVKVTASNACSFSFEGPDVSVEVRALPVHGEGTIVRAVGQFRDPIPSRGTSETQMVIACPRCDEVTHRFEVRLMQ